MLANEDINLLAGKYKLIQRKMGLEFSVDAVILSDFFAYPKKGKNTGYRDWEWSYSYTSFFKEKGEDITGIDIQEENAELAEGILSSTTSMKI